MSWWGWCSVKAGDGFKRMMIWTWASVAVKRGVVGRIVDMGGQARCTLFGKRRAILDPLQGFEDAALRGLAVVLGGRGLTENLGWPSGTVALIYP